MSHQSSRSPTASPPKRQAQYLQSVLQRRALGDDALFDEPPERDRQLARQGNNPDLSASHSHSRKSFMPPPRELALRLIAKPEPGELDERLPGELRPGFVDAAVAAHLAACVGAR